MLNSKGAAKLCAYRYANNITLCEAADQLLVNPTTQYQLEQGTFDPPEAMREFIAEWSQFAVSPSDWDQPTVSRERIVSP